MLILYQTKREPVKTGSLFVYNSSRSKTASFLILLVLHITLIPVHFLEHLGDDLQFLPII